jgi:hypothetical protein
MELTPAPPPPTEIDGFPSVASPPAAGRPPGRRTRNFGRGARTFRPVDSPDDAWSEATHDGERVIDSGRRHAARAHSPLVSALLWTMVAFAGLAICVTLVSMVRRWLTANGQHRPHSDSELSQPGLGFWVIVPPAPVSNAAARFGRPVRIDAYQPMTRLSLELGIVGGAAGSPSSGGQRTAA